MNEQIRARYAELTEQYGKAKVIVPRAMWDMALNGDFADYEELAMEFARLTILYASASALIKGEM
jgi:hypothetical protein